MRSRLLALLALALAGCLADAPGDTIDQGPVTVDVAPELPAKLAWRQLASATLPRAEHCAANVGSKFYVMGGFVIPNPQSAPGEAGAVPTGPPVNAVEIYDAATNSWAPGPPYPTVLEHCLAIGLGDTVYVFYEVIGTGAPSSYKLK